MTWLYRISDGQLDLDDTFFGTGYSGTGEGRNNPAMVKVRNIGPIPPGIYTIGSVYDHPHLGRIVMNLDPEPETETFGRSAFRIHGDNKTHDASHGCIILGPTIRSRIAGSMDRELKVIP